MISAIMIGYGQEIVPDQRLDRESEFLEAKKFALIGEVAKAEKLFKELYDEDKSDAYVTFELAKLYRSQENYTDAFNYADLTLKKEKDNEHFMSTYGIIAMESGKYDNAISVLSGLHKKYPSNEVYGDQLATAYELKGAYKDAIQVYEALESHVGLSEDLAREKIDLYKLMGDESGVENELKKLVDYDPNELNYLHNLASYYTSHNQEEKARGIYEKILALDKTDATANLALVSKSSTSPNDNNYLRALTPIIENATIPVDRKVLELIPYVDDLANNNDPELGSALESVTDRLRNTHPDEAKAYAIYADVLMINGKVDEAITAYNKTLKLNNRVYSVWEQLMYAYRTKKNYNELQKLSEEAMDYFPNQATAYLYQGEALRHQGKVDDAIEILDEAVLIATGNNTLQSNLYTAIGEAYLDQNRNDQARTALDKALEANENNEKAKKLLNRIN